MRSGLDNLGARSEIEIERADERQFTEDERLACQTQLYNSVTIEIPQFGT